MSPKRIGIINYHYSHNYGSILQSYAMWKVLRNLNYDAQIIDYRPIFDYGKYNNPVKPTIFLIGRNIKSILLIFLRFTKTLLARHNVINKEKILKSFNFKNIIPFNSYFVKSKKFKYFLKNYVDLTKERFKTTEDLEGINNRFDILLVGSDQVWNMKVHNKDFSYFLSFVDSQNVVKVSYAASFGDYYPDENLKPLVAEALSKFSRITVRDNKSFELVKELINKKPDILVDPTFLIDYSEIIKEPLIKDRYTLSYLINSPVLYDWEFVKTVERLTSSTVVSLNKSNVPSVRVKLDAGPEDFINLIYYADLVLTDSFHGTCFSIIFKKNFIVVPYGSRGTRIKELLNRLGLGCHRVIEKKRSWEEAISHALNNLLDYEVCEKILQQEKLKSFSFLSTL